MIVEHSFVTTLDPADAFALAEELLTPLRFVPEGSPESRGTHNSPSLRLSVSSSLPQDSSLIAHRSSLSSASRSWRRGAATPGKARGQGDIPTRVRMDFDRGRVVVAASVEARGMDAPRNPKLLAVGITLALERALALGHPLAEARADCDRYHTRMAGRDFFRNAFLITSLAIAVAMIVALIAVSASR